MFDPNDATYQAWAKKYPRHAWTLETMRDSSFRNVLRKQVTQTGALTRAQMERLWQLADDLETVCRGEVVPPQDGDTLNEVVLITSAQCRNSRIGIWYVHFRSKHGWGGHIRTLEGTSNYHLLTTHVDKEVLLTGHVGWVQGTYVIPSPVWVKPL